MIYRQGDVLIVKTDQKPDGWAQVDRDAGRVVLAYGEVTGHAHAIREKDVVLFTNGRGARILAVASEAHLAHDEHATITLPPGLYEVRHQREWTDADEPIEVAD